MPESLVAQVPPHITNGSIVLGGRYDLYDFQAHHDGNGVALAEVARPVGSNSGFIEDVAIQPASKEVYVIRTGTLESIIERFDNTGTNSLGAFAASLPGRPYHISFDPTGLTFAYIAMYSVGPGWTLFEVDSTGSFVRSWYLGEDTLSIYGTDLGDDGRSYVLATDQDVRRLNVCTGSTWETVVSGFPPLYSPNGVAVMPNGDILLADIEDIKRFSPAGVLQRTYNTPGGSFGWVDVDAETLGGAFWAVTDDGSGAFKFNAATGAVIATANDTTFPGTSHYRVAVTGGTFVPPNGPTPIVYVHGVNGSAGDDALVGLLTQLETDGGVNVSNFKYYQDKFCEPPLPSTPAVDTSTSIPVTFGINSPTNSDNSICDSEPSLALNSIRLYEQVIELHLLTGKRVILLGYSMGAATIRGAIDYAVRRGEDPSAWIDSVFFLGGAHDGSWWARCGVGGEVSCTGSPLQLVLKIALSSQGFSPNRPAVHDLSAKSNWYRWANQASIPGIGSSYLPDGIGYYNAYGSIDVRVRTCFMRFCVHPTTNIGDGVLYRGSDNPYDTKGGGGARFLPSHVPDRHQWEMKTTWTTSVSDLTKHPNQEANELLGLPQFHSNLTTSLGSLVVDNCAGSGQESLEIQLLKIIRSRLGHPEGVPCSP